MLAVELNIPQHVEHHKRDVNHIAGEARRHAEDLERKAKEARAEATSNTAMVLAQHKQELSNLEFVHQKLTELAVPAMEHGDLLAVLAEKVDDFDI
jgi:hypothetical protein